MEIPKLPKTIYVKWGGVDEDSLYLSADVEITGLDDGDQVGVYELRAVSTKRVKHTLD